MILHAFNPHTTETRPAWTGAALRSWRWAIVAGRWFIGIDEQVRHGSGEWQSSHSLRYRCVGLSADLQIGLAHAYYDGAHHTLWLGPLWVAWSADYCETCMTGDDDEGLVDRFVAAVLIAAMGGVQ